MEACLDLMRYQLTYNIYPFHDPRLRSAARPVLAASDEAAATAGGSPGGAKMRRKKGSGGAGALK